MLALLCAALRNAFGNLPDDALAGFGGASRRGYGRTMDRSLWRDSARQRATN